MSARPGPPDHPADPLAEALADATVARLGRRLRARPGVEARPDQPVRRAAVALVFRRAAGGALELLFIKRAEYEGDPWSGHVAFPGGRHEPGDATLEETAIRETREELALDLARDGRLLGTLDDLYPRSPALPPIVVRPYVFVTKPDPALAPSHEVAAAFWVPLAWLQAADATVESTIEVRGAQWRVPSFVHEGHTIWGMTERILRQLLELLVD